MKKKRISVILGLALTVAILTGIAIPFIGSAAGAGDTAITVLNPLGQIEPTTNQPLAARLSDFSGKKIALAYYAKAQNPHSVRAIGEMLEKDYGITAQLFNLGSSIGAKSVDYYATLAEYDAVVLGVADCTLSAWWGAYHAKMIEALGKPVVVLTHSSFEKSLKTGAMDNGFTGVRYAILDPGLYSAGFTVMTSASNTDFLRNTAFVTTTDKVPVSVYEQVKKALTDPLSNEESNPPAITAKQLAGWSDKELDPTAASFTISAQSEEKAALEFNRMAMDLGFGDGLPLIMPLPELVDEMLAATTRDRNDIIGKVMPRGGTITVEKVAINSVMAGAKPKYFPVILAAMDAYASSWEEGNLLYHSLSSSDNYTLMLVVSGPIVNELNISGQWGYLGSGNEANNGIGHAVRLSIRNIGQNRTHETDGTARVGRQNDFALTVFGEQPNLLPEGWEGIHEMMGFAKEQSTVTLHGYATQTMYGAMGGVNASFDPMSIIGNVRNQGSTNIGIATIPRDVADLARSKNGIENKTMLWDYMLRLGSGNQKVYSKYLIWPVIVGDPDSARLYRDTANIYGTKAFQTRLITGAVLTQAGKDATTPGAPQNFTVTRSGSDAVLTWSAPLNDGGSAVTGYEVSCTAGAAGGVRNPEGVVPDLFVGVSFPAAAAGSSIPVTGKNLTKSDEAPQPAWIEVSDGSMSYTFTGLDAASEYVFEVRAVNAVRDAVQVIGSGNSTETSTYALDYSISGRGAWADANTNS